MKDIVATQHPIPGYNITHSKRFCMAHMEVTRRVWEHIEHIFTWSFAVVCGLKYFVIFPITGPALLNGRKRKLFASGLGLIRCVRHDFLSTTFSNGQSYSECSLLAGLISRPTKCMVGGRRPAGTYTWSLAGWWGGVPAYCATATPTYLGDIVP